MSLERLERNQIWVYAAGLLLGAALGLALPGLGSALEVLIYPVLAVLLYATFLQVPFRELRRSFTHGRYMGAALTVNFLVVPAVAWLLARLAPQDPAVLLGVYLVLLTPCIDYVIVFAGIGGGEDRLILASTPALMLLQMLLLPFYLWLFMGAELVAAVEVRPFLEAFLLLIILPLGLALITERWAKSTQAGERWTDAMSWLPVPFMAITLLVVVASQLPKIGDSLGQVARVVPVYVAFLVVMAVVGVAAARAFGLDTREGRALVFTGATRNSLVVLPLALALPAAFDLTPAVVVTQTLVELAGLLVYVRLVPSWLLPEAA
ncbi:MAG: bile acid:sodium symporter [Rubrobacteraceae bacterium]